MNICFLNAIGELGGGELWVLRACKALQAANAGVSVICPYRSRLHDACVQQDIDFFTYSFTGGTPFYEPIFHFLKKRAIDVLYCTVIGTFWEADALRRIVLRINRERQRQPLVLILKTGLPPMPLATPEFYGIGLGPDIRRLHVVSAACKQAFLDWDLRFTDDFVEIHHEGISLSRYNRERYNRKQACEALGLPTNRRIVACIARLVPMKGQHDLLEAGKALLYRHPDLFFVFAGEGSEQLALEKLAQQLGIAHSVRFMGYVDDVPALLAASDLLCHPSLNDGLPNALVEAMAMETPVVASEVGGVPDLINHEETGFLYTPGDKHALTNMINRALDAPYRVMAIIKQARKRVEADFDFSHNIDRLVGRLLEEQAMLDLKKCSATPFQSSLQGVITGEATTLPTHDWAQNRRGVSSPIPVLFVMTVLRTGGEETELSILAQHLDPRRFKLLALSCFPVDEPSSVPNALKRASIPLDTECHRIESLENKVRHIIDVIRREGVRIVVACQDTTLAYHAVNNLPPNQCRLIEHGGILDEVWRIPKNRTARYIGVSKAIAEAAQPLLDDAKKALFIPSMVDFTAFKGYDRKALRAAYGLPPDDCIIVFIGRLDAKKRIETFISAAAEILTKRGDVLFIVVGPPDAYQPEYARQIYEIAKPLTESGRLIFTDARDDVATILCASDILALPAIGEGMSHVINEAGAAGLAVVATDSGAAAEQLDHGRAGRLVPSHRPDLFLSALEELIGNADTRARLGGTLRAWVRCHYAVDQVVPQWIKLFEALEAELPYITTAPAMIVPDDEVLPFPREIQIQTNTLCNASCIMCPYTEVSQEFSYGRMEEGLYRDILAQCSREPGLARIEPFLMNEPFTDNRIVDWITLAKQLVQHALVTVTTNGAAVLPKVADRLVQTGLDAIWFSFNGAAKETYENIMGISFDHVKSNIHYLLSIKSPNLQIFTNMIETTEMRGEIEENVHYWQSLGVGSGSSTLVNRGGNVKNFEALNYRLQSQKPIRVCDLLFHKLYILYNGDVVLCCMDWRRQVVMGNLQKQSIREIWHGEKYRHYRCLHQEGRTDELLLCATCSYCHN